VPVTPTYPGVYVEELPSAVRTIVGVPTAITAFVGYTKRGPADSPIQVLSFGDYERAFGPLDPDCPVGYAVQQFFQNGGAEAYIVRVAEGAAKATLEMLGSAGTSMLILEARSSGIWGNTLAITVDYDTLNPLSLFNVSVATPDASETHRNLTMNSKAPTYAVAGINANSTLVKARRGPAATVAGTVFGTSSNTSRAPGTTLTALGAGPHKIAVSVDGSPPLEVPFTVPSTGGALANYTQAATDIAAYATSHGLILGKTINPGTGTGAQQMVFTSGTGGEASSVRFSSAGTDNAAAVLGLGVANGGLEVDAAAGIRPIETGATGNAMVSVPAPPPDPKVRVALHNSSTVSGGTALATTDVTLKLPVDRTPTAEDARAALEKAMRVAGGDPANAAMGPALAGTQIRLYNGAFHVTPGGGPDAMFRFAGATGDATTFTALGLDYAAANCNLAFYTPALGAPLRGQGATVRGSDGQPPTSDAVFVGNEADKTGINALVDVDLVNILCIPDRSSFTVQDAAASWCEQHRCFYIADIPSTVRTPADAQAWIRDPSTHPTSNYAAAYYPRIVSADPKQNYQSRAMSGSGAIAGLYARTDTTRGVWKAPAGTEAALRGVLGTDYLLTNAENGTINPLGLNAVRSLPIYGNVVWGARTLEGADQSASQWKYIPVRRTALFIEESLFRGTQWVVFEPNDEPLWMQIRLNVGAFMHSLFRQHAFQGLSPRDAYLVKCDSETTTQDDINKGIVNIVVGFAPLKPAEFVILQITQLAGQVEV
jgi:phage tail sheath protein FI